MNIRNKSAHERRVLEDHFEGLQCVTVCYITSDSTAVKTLYFGWLEDRFQVCLEENLLQKRVEKSSWKAGALPLSYARMGWINTTILLKMRNLDGQDFATFR